MKTFNYNPDLTGYNIVKTNKEQFDAFFSSGHPNFLIPDFCKEPCDVWLSFLDYFEEQLGYEVYDQDGGEVSDNKVIDSTSGLTVCKYTSYGIQKEEDSDYEDIDVEITGYVAEDTNGSFVFIATQVHVMDGVIF